VRYGCDLLIADLGLPDGSGLDLAREVRATHHRTKAIALSGYTEDADKAACAEAGFSAFVPKPVKFDELEPLIEQLLSR
jgi:DNA-binding response OmpR family regulator